MMLRSSKGAGTCRRHTTLFSLNLLFLMFFAAVSAQAGPYVDAGQSPASMTAWATAIDGIDRGLEDIALPAGPDASAGDPANVLGASTGVSTDTVSLGDAGTITVYLDSGISNGPGDDFAVFENAFFDFFGLFAELAYVEVASNGVDFAEFESDTVNTSPVLSFGTLDPTDYHGLAGRHAAPLGTGFDLADLASNPLVLTGTVDLMDVRYVRLTDVIGDGSTTDTFGNPIYDPYSTAFPAGGFDLEAVGVIHVPEPGFALALFTGILGLLGATSNRGRRSTSLAAAIVGVTLAGPAAALTATFDDLGLGAESFENGAGLAGGDLVSGGIALPNTYFASFDGFSGFAASTTTDTTTPGFTNQYSNITGGGAGGSDGFGINFGGGNIILSSEQTVLGADITNTTYAYLSMLNGDPFAKQFGGASGDDADFFRLIIEGIDGSGASTGTVDFWLADYTDANNANDYIIDAWTYVDLTGLGSVKELAFSFESSDVGEFGINTPSYFAIDNLTVIPEPGTALLLGLGLAGLARSRRER